MINNIFCLLILPGYKPASSWVTNPQIGTYNTVSQSSIIKIQMSVSIQLETILFNSKYPKGCPFWIHIPPSGCKITRYLNFLWDLQIFFSRQKKLEYQSKILCLQVLRNWKSGLLLKPSAIICLTMGSFVSGIVLIQSVWKYILLLPVSTDSDYGLEQSSTTLKRHNPAPPPLISIKPIRYLDQGLEDTHSD